MAQVHLTLEDDILKDLMLGNREDAVSKLLEKVFDAVLKAQASEQLNAEPYERSDDRSSYRNGYRTRSMTTRAGRTNQTDSNHLLTYANTEREFTPTFWT